MRIGLLLASLLLAACGGGPQSPVCQASPTPLGAAAFCAPQRIAANQPLRLQLREQCGGCTSYADRCEVQVKGQDVTLRLLGQTCTLAPDTACPALCRVATFDCAVPALAPGTYRVVADAPGSTTAVMMTTDLAISATACTLPQP